jgi:hypothetical protein
MLNNNTNYSFNIYMNSFEDIVNTNSVFIFLTIFTGGLFLSFTITSMLLNFGYNDDIEGAVDEYVNTLDNEYDEDYIYKYDELFESSKLEYIDYEMKENYKKELKNIFITEKTPKGDIIMSYNYYQEDPILSSFYYYCNDSSIQYNILETVAKKYVCENKCLFFFITNDKSGEKDESKTNVINNEISKNNEIIKNNETKVENKTSTIFANFRNYNKKQFNSNTSANTSSNSSEKNKNIIDLTVSISKNRFTRLGNINDYNEIINKKNMEIDREKTIHNISFSDFKKQKFN